MKTYIIAIDHGTSGVKTALATVHGEIIAFESEKTSLIFTPDGGIEQDPDEWWRAIIKTTSRLVGKGLVPVEEIEAICCSSTFSSTVAVDSGGKHLMNSLTWMDSRGAQDVRKTMKGLINMQGYSLSKLLKWIPRSGGAPGMSGKDDAAHVLYIKNHHPEIYNKTYKFLGSKDYLNLKLSGKFAASYDSATLFWVTDNRNINNIKYDTGLIKALGTDIDKFPPLMRSTDILGTITKEFAAETGLSALTKVVVGSPDLQSACIGSGAVEDFEGHIYIGTSSWVLCHVPFKKTDMFHIIASLPSSIPGKYFCANEQESAGKNINFLIENLLYHKSELRDMDYPTDVYERLEKVAAGVAPGSGGVIYTPWLNGEKTPVENHAMRGGFHNLSLRINMDHLTRAVMEGVAYNTRWSLGYVEKFIGGKLDPLNIIGGGAQSDTWCGIFADVLGRTIRQVEDPIQSNARGAAFIASVALGHIQFTDISKIVRFSNIYEPNFDNKKIYDKLFKEFLEIYKHTKAIYKRMN